MTCRQSEERLSSYLDQELGAPERTALEAHLGSCADCQRSLEALKTQSRELEAAFLPLRSKSDALARQIISTLASEPAPRERRGWVPPVLAAAAGFLLAAGLFAAWPSRPPSSPVAEPPERVQVRDLTAELDRERQTCQELERKLTKAALAADSLKREQALRSELEQRLAQVQKDDEEARNELGRRLKESEARIQVLSRELAQKVDPKVPRVDPPPAPAATLQTAIGTVELQVGADWRPLVPGEGVAAGACVRTPPESKGSFTCPDGTEVRMNGASEAQWTEPRALRLKEGELFARVAAARTPFLFRTDQGTFEANPGAYDLAHSVDSTPQKFKKGPPRTIVTMAVADGSAMYARGKSSEFIPPSTACELSEGTLTRPRTVDWVLKSRWIHELLRPGTDDLEIDRRVAAMLLRMGDTKTPEVYELEIRAFGERSAGALKRVIQAPTPEMDAFHRREAARLLGDLAGATSVPDLVALLRDPDRELRSLAQKGLERLTGLRQETPEAWSHWLQDTQALWGRPPEASKKAPLK